MRHANEDKKNAETAIVIYFNEQHLASPRVQIVRGAEGIGGGGGIHHDWIKGWKKFRYIIIKLAHCPFNINDCLQDTKKRNAKKYLTFKGT